MKLTRVGDWVYRDEKPVAVWAKGAWYKPQPRTGPGLELEHIDPRMSTASAELVRACSDLRWADGDR